MAKELEVKDLKEADYNPRWINDKRLKALQKSIETFGDLSGVVFNRRTKRLVSGHQRLKTVRDKKTRIVTKPYSDKYGTVAIGHIEVKDKKGVIQIPYREVDWDDKKMEMAANIAANAQGGQFDNKKLGKVLAKLSNATFDVELVGLDDVTVKTLVNDFEKASGVVDAKGKPVASGKDKGKSSKSEGFQKISPEDMEEDFEHECPKCNYKW